MASLERKIITENDNGSRTVRTVVTVESAAPYASGEVVLMDTRPQMMKWKKAGEIIPNVPTPSRRRELIAQARQGGTAA